MNRISRIEVLPRKRDVLRRNVVKFGMALAPAELEVVLAHNAGVGGRADREIDRAIRGDRWAVGVVVADARKLLYQRRDLSVRANAHDSPTIFFAALGDVEVAFVKCHARPGRGVAASD